MSPTAGLSPITPGERLEVIDIVRGFALFGIIAANMRAFNSPMAAYFDHSLMWMGAADRVAQAFVDFFISGKFITLFSFLFGIGFLIIVERAEAKGVSGARLLCRRLFVLFLFGALHALLLWSGDILAPYALMGFPLLLFRRRRQKTVLIWALFFYFWPNVIGAVLLWAASAGAPIPMPPPATPEDLTRIVAVFSSGTYGEIFMERLKELGMLYAGIIFFYPRVLGVFLLGLYVWRTGILRNLAAHRPLLLRLRNGGLAVGIVGNGAAVAIMEIWHPNLMAPTPLAFAAGCVFAFGVPAMSLFYASAIALLYDDRVWRERLRIFAPIGRTALSNYLLQTVICTAIYQSWGFGLYGSVGPALGLIPTVIIYAAQVRASIWWTERFAFGPAEWLWRSLAYGRRPSFRLRRPLEGAGGAV